MIIMKMAAKSSSVIVMIDRFADVIALSRRCQRHNNPRLLRVENMNSRLELHCFYFRFMELNLDLKCYSKYRTAGMIF